MRPTARRFTIGLAAGVVLLGMSAAPALAGAPTPSSMKMAKVKWQKVPASDLSCVFASECGTKAWISTKEDSGLIDSYGYVKGKKAAKVKIAEVTDSLAEDEAFRSAKFKKYTYKYKTKKVKHKTKIMTYRFVEDGLDAQLILSFDVQHKNGKLKKKVPVGIMFQAQETKLGNKLHKKKGKILKKQVAKLNAIGMKIQMVGPIPTDDSDPAPDEETPELEVLEPVVPDEEGEVDVEVLVR